MAEGIRYQVEGSSALKAQYDHQGLAVYEGGLRDAPVSAGRRTTARAPLRSPVVVALAAVAMLALVAAVSFADSLSTQALDSRLDAAPREVVYVQPGDTLWSLASSKAGAGVSTERVVTWIMEANHLADSSIQPGTRLVIPVLAP